MCKLGGIKWAVIKSNKTISKNLSGKLNKIRFVFTEENTVSFYYFNEVDFESMCAILRTYKKLSFEVIRFYDRQFGLSVNSWGVKKIGTEKLPLSKTFFWFKEGNNRQTVTPITNKQYNNVIRINQ